MQGVGFSRPGGYLEELRKYLVTRNKLIAALAALSLAFPMTAAEHHGTVTFGGLPVPGAKVTAVRDGKTMSTVTDLQGNYSFPDLADGEWSMQVEMLAFAPLRRDVNVAPGAAAEEWELKLLPLEEIKSAAAIISRPATPRPAEEVKNGAPADKESAEKEKPKEAAAGQEAAAEPNPDTADNFLINGSVNNGASSPFAQFAAFGNNRRGAKGLYNGMFGFILDNSATDARPYSLTGQDTQRPSYNHLTGLATFGGPLKIPRLIRNGPVFFVGYQWTRNRNASIATALMPTLAQRAGDFSGLPQIYDANGVPIPGNIISPTQFSKQALGLLKYYPQPNFSGSSRYNYQVPLTGSTHQDALQTRLNKPIGRKHQVYGSLGLQSSRTDSVNEFGFLDTADSLGLSATIGWRQVFTPRFFGNASYTFSRMSSRTTPFFENRENVSGDLGITGNLQNPTNWGPPALNFASGIAGLTDAGASFTRNETNALSYSIFWGRGRHNVQAGIDYRRQQFNLLAQQDARGTFTFTGVTTQSDFASFLLGIPDTSSIAYGNADKYFRASTYNAYANDDWRVNPELTINAGIRWEYGSPITELYGRLVNLDLAPGFTKEAAVVANHPVGSVTGQRYPDSLIHPDKRGFEPRVGISWRPVAGSSIVVRAGYGVYYNTSVYQNIATQMAQQAPLSKSLSVANSPETPLTLANGFITSSDITPTTFAVDPNFRPGYAQNWQVSVQRDLPAGMVMTATYLGIKGTRGQQEFLPNTYPAGAVDPCPLCPTGFVYLASNGNSTREAGMIQLRRRLHNGFTATLQYTYAKAIDDVSTLGGSAQVATVQSSGGAGGPGGGANNSSASSSAAQAPTGGSSKAAIAQDWLDLSAERGLSSFDQRHLLNVQAQYTTGMGVRGGMLMSGWRGALLKEWTITTTVTKGTGLPLTPVYLVPVTGTGVTGSVRPDYTGANVYAAPAGAFLNPGAYTAPAKGQWGNAGRNSITGPGQFTLNGSMTRTFRLNDRFNLDATLTAANLLNHVTFPSWSTVINNPSQFGLPAAANPMRTVQTTVRLRF